MHHDFCVKTENLVLSPMQRNDIEPLRILRNLDQNRKWFFDDRIISKESQESWFSAYLEKKEFRIALRNDPAHYVGSVAIIRNSCEFGEAEIGRLLLDSKHLPLRGLSTEAISGCASIAFCEMGLNKLYSRVFKENDRSIEKFLGVGFIEIGYYSMNGRDIVVFQQSRDSFI